MGWPKKDETMRIYKDRGDNGYIVIDIDDDRPGCELDAIANVYPGPRPSLAHTRVSKGYIAANWLKRVQWEELFPEWQEAIAEYNGRDPAQPPFRPEAIRGFWRVGKQPRQVAGADQVPL